MTYGASIGAALAAAVSFAVAAVFQQESAQSVGQDKSLSLRLLAELLRRPRWLAGVGFLLAGYGLQALALAFGPVALVQPIIVVELAVAIPLGILRGQGRVGWREWAGIVCVMGGVSLFVGAASPSPGTPEPAGSAWLASLVPVGGVAAAAVAFGACSSGRARAVLLGVAAGLSFAVLSVLTKATTHELGVDVAGAFGTWQLYTTAVVGIVALVASQSAYQAGPLAYSLPFIDVLEPAVAAVMGDTVLGEQVRLSTALFALEIFGGAIACAGIVALTTSPTVLGLYEQHVKGPTDAVPEPIRRRRPPGGGI